MWDCWGRKFRRVKAFVGSRRDGVSEESQRGRRSLWECWGNHSDYGEGGWEV